MQNRLLVEVLQGLKHACYEESCLFLVEFFVLRQVVSEITALHQINHEIQVLTVFKRKIHVH